MADFRNFIVGNKIVMKQIKPLDQVFSIGADAHNHTPKVVNKFGSRNSILYRLKDYCHPLQKNDGQTLQGILTIYILAAILFNN